MRRRLTNIDGLCDALNAMGIRTTILDSTASTSGKVNSVRQVEKARRQSLKEISRISRNAKRLTSRKI